MNLEFYRLSSTVCKLVICVTIGRYYPVIHTSHKKLSCICFSNHKVKCRILQHTLSCVYKSLPGRESNCHVRLYNLLFFQEYVKGYLSFIISSSDKCKLTIIRIIRPCTCAYKFAVHHIVCTFGKLLIPVCILKRYGTVIIGTIISLDSIWILWVSVFIICPVQLFWINREINRLHITGCATNPGKITAWFGENHNLRCLSFPAGLFGTGINIVLVSDSIIYVFRKGCAIVADCHTGLNLFTCKIKLRIVQRNIHIGDGICGDGES